MTRVAFLIVDQRPADAVRFPGAFTQLAPRGHGQAIAERWNHENLAALVAEHEERWKQQLAGQDGSADEAGAGSGDAGPTAAEVERIYQEAVERWTAKRDQALAAAGGDFTTYQKLKWGSEHPPPTVEGVFEEAFGRPYPRARAGASERKSVPRPDPPRGAEVEEIESAWCARIEGAPSDETERVLSESGLIPRSEIATYISELAGDGWTVIHWSDDRRVVHDADVSRAETIGISVVLQRA